MSDELEELESIHAYDAAKASVDDAVPFEQATREIEHRRGELFDLGPAPSEEGSSGCQRIDG